VRGGGSAGDAQLSSRRPGSGGPAGVVDDPQDDRAIPAIARAGKRNTEYQLLKCKQHC
jgi:hypothetical protein